MMERLLPAEVAVAEATDKEWQAEPLEPEAALVARAVDRRRREFAAGRACARLALGRLGLQPGPLLSGPDRDPLWPPAVVGSITHCSGYCAAAVARRQDALALGIDAEVNQALDEGVARLVCTERELAWTAANGDAGTPWQALIFSAKESVYKAWQPLTRQWLGYLDAELSIDPLAGRFEARLLVPAPSVLGQGFRSFGGRFAVTATHVLTAVVLPPV